MGLNVRQAIAAWVLVAVISSVVALLVFQSFVRYRYERLGGVTWRIDQLTNQRCRMTPQGPDCAPDLSTSTSTSLSTSTSTSLTVATRGKKKG